jgi:hypothetical protein
MGSAHRFSRANRDEIKRRPHGVKAATSLSGGFDFAGNPIEFALAADFI